MTCDYFYRYNIIPTNNVNWTAVPTINIIRPVYRMSAASQLFGIFTVKAPPPSPPPPLLSAVASPSAPFRQACQPLKRSEEKGTSTRVLNF